MNRALQALALLTLAACAPAKAPQTAAPPQAPAPVAAAPAPAKHATMICRNSQDGRNVACGTPNAVMVGIKQD
ncbi:MAG: hypothetical protein M3T55_10600 [Pseudomonadota bacterium]|nr:hypothetical protein [Pseudomonadota bacterium]